MDDATHLLQYRRFFGILFSVLPGLVLTYALAAGVIWLVADVIQAPWGLAVGLGGLTFTLILSGWLFVGMGIQRWTEDKSATFLFAVNAPFLIIFLGFMVWLFFAVVVNATGPGSEEHAALLLRSLPFV